MKKAMLSLSEVRFSINELRGKLIQIRINKGRKRIVKTTGQVIDTYPSVFTMKLSGDESNIISYSYNDIICGTIKIESAEK